MGVVPLTRGVHELRYTPENLNPQLYNLGCTASSQFLVCDVYELL